jgi:hypothetical protein
MMTRHMTVEEIAKAVGWHWNGSYGVSQATLTKAVALARKKWSTDTIDAMIDPRVSGFKVE